MKRMFDIVCASLGLIILSPVLLGIAFSIKLSSPGPVLFCQTRVGKHGMHFGLHKFRTMVVGAEGMGPNITIGSDVRITKIGRFLRCHKLDELPQLFDVFWGYMSLVGPRPEVPEYVKQYPDEIRQVVLSVRPGITDEASLRLINESELLARSVNPQVFYQEVLLPQKLADAVRYVETRTFSHDCAILLTTIKVILYKLVRC